MPGLHARILKVKWPQDGNVQQLSNFETVARKLRYQALGQACLDHNIQSLLVAHHQDDQAETVMMRMAEGHKGRGLKGILPVSDIPECWAMHGVHQSGAGEAAERVLAEIEGQEAVEQRHQKTIDANLKGHKSPPLRIEEGGVKVYRPFLGFDKERLRATCLASRVAWVEDETNQNPALTQRNAVRKLLRLGGLPQAIQKASLLALARRVHQKHLGQTTRAERQFRLCMIDTRSGVAVVRLSLAANHLNHFVPAVYLHQQILRKRLQCALVVRRMAQIVAPVQFISGGDLSFAVEALFSERIDPTSREQIFKFSCGGVNFERVRSDIQQTRTPFIDRQFVWALSRQPFPAGRPSPSLTVPTRLTTQNGDITFSLWDGRFWFRVFNHHSRPVVVRPFYPADLTWLRANLTKEEARDLDESLRVVAPGKVRWTLPVIAEAEDDDGGEAEEGSRDDLEHSYEAEEYSHETLITGNDSGEDNHQAEESLDKEAEEEKEDEHLDAKEPANHAVNSNSSSLSSSSSSNTSNTTVTETATETEPPTPNPNPNPTTNPHKEKNKTKKKQTSYYKKYSQRTGGRILALPTLNWDFGARERKVEWEVRYKHVKWPSPSGNTDYRSIVL